jgi:hypothetical protein
MRPKAKPSPSGSARAVSPWLGCSSASSRVSSCQRHDRSRPVISSGARLIEDPSTRGGTPGQGGRAVHARLRGPFDPIERGHDVAGGVGGREAANVGPEGGEAGGVAEDPVEFPSGSAPRLAYDSGSAFVEVTL